LKSATGSIDEIKIVHNNEIQRVLLSTPLIREVKMVLKKLLRKSIWTIYFPLHL
jgi:hypothetical protein